MDSELPPSRLISGRYDPYSWTFRQRFERYRLPRKFSQLLGSAMKRGSRMTLCPSASRRLTKRWVARTVLRLSK